MEKGRLSASGGVSGPGPVNVRWMGIEEEKIFPKGFKESIIGDWLGVRFDEAYRCGKCKLIIFRYGKETEGQDLQENP